MTYNVQSLDSKQCQTRAKPSTLDTKISITAELGAGVDDGTAAFALHHEQSEIFSKRSIPCYSSIWQHVVRKSRSAAN